MRDAWAAGHGGIDDRDAWMKDEQNEHAYIMAEDFFCQTRCLK